MSGTHFGKHLYYHVSSSLSHLTYLCSSNVMDGIYHKYQGNEKFYEWSCLSILFYLNACYFAVPCHSIVNQFLIFISARYETDITFTFAVYYFGFFWVAYIALFLLNLLVFVYSSLCLPVSQWKSIFLILSILTFCCCSFCVVWL